jgi:OmpA-OmpF porin, OOP family
MGYKRLTLFFAFLMGATSLTFAQDAAESGEVFNINQLPEEYWPSESRIKEKNQQQFEDYKEGNTIYPPRQRHMPAIGVSAGFGFVNGDVKSRPGYGTGLFVRHNIGYILSVRYEFNYLQTYGQQTDPRSLRGDLMNNPNTAIRNKAYSGAQNGVNYSDFGIRFSYDNYKTQIMDLGADLIINFGNIMMHKADPRVNLYGGVGFGGMIYKTMIDALDANGNPYNYNEARASIAQQGLEGRDVRKFLEDNYYGSGKRDYETYGEGFDPSKDGFFDRRKNTVIRLSLGVEFLLGEKKRFALGIEHRANYVGDDLLDGVRWSEQGDLTPQNDVYHFTNAKLAINLGSKDKRNTPMWWTNPVALMARKYEAPGDRFKDSDGDGIDDHYDLEPDTKEGCPVDSKGRKLDSDGDGCPDCEDPEPFSSPLLPIVDCKNVYDGFATKECCDEKLLLGSLKDKCDNIVFPTVSFEYDRFGLKAESYSALEQIAKLLQECPDVQVVVTGVTNTTKNVKYNEQLSWTRVNAAVDHLVEKYGISRDRFIVKYQGSTIKSEGGDFDKFQNNRVEFRAAQSGEAGSSNPPAPHPGYKAGRP